MDSVYNYVACMDDTGENCSDGEISVVLAPYSMMTLTTLEAERPDISEIPCKELTLPYTDDFIYKNRVKTIDAAHSPDGERAIVISKVESKKGR